jgi:tRNA dimethylallyltransferase
MIICVVGPTAVGKTKLSVELAKKYNGIVINCDAMQVYKDLNIGTAKATKEEQEGIKHELLDFVPVTTDYTVYDYQKDARELLKSYEDRNIIFVGGTGLYLRAALYDYQFKEEIKNNNNYDGLSNEEIYQFALNKDKNIDIHPNNRQRLIRFLNKEDNIRNDSKELYKAIYIGLTTDRNELYKRIDNRVDEMINNGLLEEVKTFYDKGIRSKALTTGIGYKELYDYFDNKCSLEEAIDLIKKRSRHYAKRQYTFFNHQLPVEWFETDYKNFNKTVNEVVNYIEKIK